MFDFRKKIEYKYLVVNPIDAIKDDSIFKMLSSKFFVNIKLKLGCFFIGMLCMSNGLCQDKIKVEVNCPDCNLRNFPTFFKSEKELYKKLNKISNSYINKGYPAFSIDSVVLGASLAQIYINKGNKYYLKDWNCIPDEVDYLLPAIGKPKLFSANEVKKTELKLISELYSQGFADALVNKEFVFDQNLISLHYNVNPNQRIVYDSLIALGTSKISLNYLNHKTGIFPGRPYEKSAVESISQIINQTGFLKTDTVHTSFNQNKVRIELSVVSVKQNSFSGILGIQTNQKKETEITGDVELKLINAFKSGENMYFNWKKLAFESQDLLLQFEFPYIFKSPLGITGSGLFEKQDSSFTNTSIGIGITVPLKNYGQLEVLTQWKNTVSSDTVDINYGTANIRQYGLSYRYSVINLNQPDIRNIGLNLKILAGNKTNEWAENNEYQSFYAELLGTMDWLVPMPLGAMYFKNQTGIMINDSLYYNNLFRSGGFNSIRGFNEKSIFSKSFTFFTGAYRIMLNKNSYMEGFYDLGWFEVPTKDSYSMVRHESIGLGINLTTKAGIVSISYAIGKTDSNPYRFDNGKLHIGYLTLF